jgi:GNAT superfamily N-acetyltransferase
VLCGLIEQAVIGYAVVSTNGPAARIEAIYVEPEARELGVGEELLNAAIAWSVAQGCSTLDAVALPGDRHTKNFFETFGMVARAITVSRRL